MERGGQARVLRWRAGLTAVAALVLSLGPVAGQEAKSERIGRFITVPPIAAGTDRSVGDRVNAALRDGARVILFHVQPGHAVFEDCLKLARRIEAIQGATTVAYVSEPLTGHAVMVALVADQLVMASGGKIGDIGRDEPVVLEPMRVTYGDKARRRKNAYRAVVLGMLDKNARVLEVRTAMDTRYVLEGELAEATRGVTVVKTRVIKDRGELILLSAEQAREMGLADRLAETREKAAEAYGLSPRVAQEAGPIADRVRPVRIAVQETLNARTEEFVRRATRHALARGSNLIIYEIDSSLGQADTGLDLGEYVQNLDPERVRTVAFVNRRASGAAALLAMGCDDIVMHANGSLGECENLFQAPAPGRNTGKRSLDDAKNKLRVFAESNAYAPALAQALVDPELVVHQVSDTKTGRVTYVSESELKDAPAGTWRDLRVIKPAGRTLTMNAAQAKELDLAETVDDVSGLCELYGIDSSQLPVVSATWVDSLIWWLNHRAISAALLAIGIIALYVELKIPGIGVASIVSAVCFVLFFWSKCMGGTAGALEIVLFLGGVVCLAIEIFVLPGSLVFGASGVLMTAASLILASQTFVWPSGTREWNEFSANVGSLVGVFISLFVAAYFLSKYLPHIPLLNRMVLQPDVTLVEADEPNTLGLSPFEHLRGTVGVAMTTLRPAGRVRIGDEFIDVVTEGSYIEEGQAVRVIDVSGNRVVVKQDVAEETELL
jgi:membrane-bound serine protease (ClpP class)